MAPAASADHFAGVNADAGGAASPPSSRGRASAFTTDDWRLKVARVGQACSLVCRFASLPASWETLPDGFDQVERPRKLTDTMPCFYGADSALVPFTTGEFRILPNGSATLRCTWPPPTD